MNIGISYDLKESVSLGKKQPEDALEEYDSVETVEALKSAIAAREHTVVKLGGGREFLNRILKEKLDFVFNISEGLGTYRGREAQVPSVLEMLDIPYSGADPQCLAVCLDKHLTKKIVSLEGITTPKWQVISQSSLRGSPLSSLRGAQRSNPQPSANDSSSRGDSPLSSLQGAPVPSLRAERSNPRISATNSSLRAERSNLRTSSFDWSSLPYPAFVKPVWEGSSKGIRLNSLVREPQQMKKLVTGLLEQYQQPVLVEEFIAGEEVTVGIVGNSPPKVMGIVRVVPRKKDADFIYSLEVKRDYLNLVDYECPAKLPKKTLQGIQEMSLKAFEVLECRDFSRVDFRISPDGTPYFLEINPLAGLNPRSSDIVIMAGLLGIKYPDLIGSILDSALSRNNLK